MNITQRALIALEAEHEGRLYRLTIHNGSPEKECHEVLELFHRELIQMTQSRSAPEEPVEPAPEGEPHEGL